MMLGGIAEPEIARAMCENSNLRHRDDVQLAHHASTSHHI